MNSHRRSAWHQIATLAVVLLAWGGIATGQQTKQPSRSELQAEIAKLRAALADCQNANQNANQNAKSKSAREDAIASLRAVRSVLSIGANLDEFRKYQIESRIKVDALPNVPENRDIRDISDLYRDAITFSIVNVPGGKISADELSAAKERHGKDETISNVLAEIMSEDAVERTAAAQCYNRVPGCQNAEAFRENAHQKNGVYAKEISQILLVNADEKLSKLK